MAAGALPPTNATLFDYTGRVALVTGAGQGVGRVIAARLAAQGATVAVNDLFPERAMAVAAEITATGAAAVAAPCDVTDPGAVRSMVSAVTGEVGLIDILVNNAGVPPSGFGLQEFLETSSDDWDRYLSVNLYGVLHCSQAVLASMTKRTGGRVVTIVSDAGRIGEPLMAAYSAAKAGAMGLSRSLAKEFGAAGVTFNCLSLGWIPADPDAVDPAVTRKMLRSYPIARPGRAEDVAAAVVWLASTEASWVTGQTISIDGGYITT